MKALFVFFIAMFFSVFVNAGQVDDCINSWAQGKSCAVNAANSDQSSCIVTGCNGPNEVCLWGACIDRTSLAKGVKTNETVFASRGILDGDIVLTKLPININQESSTSGFVKVSAAKQIRCTERGSPIQLCWEEQVLSKRLVCPEKGSPQFCHYQEDL